MIDNIAVAYELVYHKAKNKKINGEIIIQFQIFLKSERREYVYKEYNTLSK
jgi:hypothetical protein